MHPDFTQAILNVLLLWILTAPHEFSHAWVATRLGDDTPRLEGRVTLNPLAHVDWLGTAILPFFTSLMGGGFIGWGRPVQTQPVKLRGGLNGLALVSLAGPASNVVMAVLLAAVAVATVHTLPGAGAICPARSGAQLVPGDSQYAADSPAGRLKAAAGGAIPLVIYQELARAGFLRVGAGCLGDEPGAVDERMGLPGGSSDLAVSVAACGAGSQRQCRETGASKRFSESLLR